MLRDDKRGARKARHHNAKPARSRYGPPGPPQKCAHSRHTPQVLRFHNDLGVKETIFHLMNADMLVTTGSSFPMVALALSPKVGACVILDAQTSACCVAMPLAPCPLSSTCVRSLL